jgi:hypothetical protein
MIEVVSYPEELLTKWDSGEHPFYLELFGETLPLIDMKGTSAPPGAQVADTAKSTSAVPIYEYSWTLGLRGLPNYSYHVPTISQQNTPTLKNRLINNVDKLFHSGSPPSSSAEQSGSTSSEATEQGGSPPSEMTGKDDASLGDLPHQDDSSKGSYWEDMNDTAAEVYILFPTNGNWRVQELVATVKYLIPAPPQHAWLTDFDHIWQAVQPIVGDVGTLAQTAGKLTGQPEFDAAGSMLSAIAKARINSVPPTGVYTWSVIKETYCYKEKEEQNVLEGLRWTLPKQMFMDFGGRLTGTVAVSFIWVGKQQANAADPHTASPPIQLPIRAYAVIYKSEEQVATSLIPLLVRPILANA